MDIVLCPQVGDTSYNTILRDMLGGLEPLNNKELAYAHVQKCIESYELVEKYELCAELLKYMNWIQNN